MRDHFFACNQRFSKGTVHIGRQWFAKSVDRFRDHHWLVVSATLGVDVSHTMGLIDQWRPDDFSYVVLVPEMADGDQHNGRKVYSRLLLSGKYELKDISFNRRNNINILLLQRWGARNSRIL